MLQNETDFEKNLSPKQLAALPHIVLSDSVAEGARRAGISRATFYRWLADPDFQHELQSLSDEAAALARARLQQLMLRSLEVIEDSLDDETSRDRFRAAIEALKLARNVVRDREIDRRLDRLEDAVHLHEDASPW